MELISDMSGGFEKRFTEDLPASGLKQLSFLETVRAFSTYEVKKSFFRKLETEDWKVLRHLLGMDEEIFTHFSDEESRGFCPKRRCGVRLSLRKTYDTC